MIEWQSLPRILWEDLKAWRRGQRRVVPRFAVNGRPTRGRIYAGIETKDEVVGGKSEPIVTVEAVVRRANGEIEVYRTGGRS